MHEIAVDRNYKPVLRNSHVKSGVQYVELHYKERAIPALVFILKPDNPLAKLKSSSTISVPIDDDRAVIDLDIFLTVGKHASAIDLEQGPPRLGEHTAGGRAVVLRDIQAHRLGAVLTIPEIQDYAISRLWNHRALHEDPITALNYLYHGSPPPKDDAKVDDKEGTNEKKKDDKKEEASRSRRSAAGMVS